MVFVDSTGSLDKHDVVVTLFVAATCVGALPIGIAITGNKSEAAYTSAFRLLQTATTEIDPASVLDPTLGMTDHDDGIRNSLKVVHFVAVRVSCIASSMEMAPF